MALQILELLTDEMVLSKLKETMFPQELSNKIDILNTTVATLSSQLREKDAKITLLEERLTKVEEDLDRCEQYSRRPNLRIQGLSDDVRGEDTERKVLEAINVNMGFKPPLEIDQIERCHRLGRVVVGQTRPRVIIVRFTKERDRDAVLSRPQVDLTFQRFRFLAPCQRLRAIVCVLSAHLRDDESSTCVCLLL